MEISLTHHKISLSALTYTLVPIGILAALTIWFAEIGEDILLGRAIYSIWLTYAVATPALCLYTLGLNQEKRKTYWLLFWTFAYLVYLLHVAWTFLGIFDGQVENMFSIQGLAIAGTNVVITLWWTADIGFAWLLEPTKFWITLERSGIQLLFFLAAIYVGIFRKEGIITGLSIVMAIGVITCLVIRLLPILAWKEEVESRK